MNSSLHIFNQRFPSHVILSPETKEWKQENPNLLSCSIIFSGFLCFWFPKFKPLQSWRSWPLAVPKQAVQKQNRLYDLSSSNLFSQFWQFKRVPADLISGEASLPRLQTTAFSLCPCMVFLCMSREKERIFQCFLLSYKDNNYSGLDPYFYDLI